LWVKDMLDPLQVDGAVCVSILWAGKMPSAEGYLVLQLSLRITLDGLRPKCEIDEWLSRGGPMSTDVERESGCLLSQQGYSAARQVVTSPVGTKNWRYQWRKCRQVAGARTTFIKVLFRPWVTGYVSLQAWGPHRPKNNSVLNP
jgi:hypothetical protein